MLLIKAGEKLILFGQQPQKHEIGKLLNGVHRVVHPTGPKDVHELVHLLAKAGRVEVGSVRHAFPFCSAGVPTRDGSNTSVVLNEYAGEDTRATTRADEFRSDRANPPNGLLTRRARDCPAHRATSVHSSRGSLAGKEFMARPHSKQTDVGHDRR